MGIDDKTIIITTSNYSKKKIQEKFNNSIYVNYQYISIFNKSIKAPNFLKKPLNYILHVGSFEKRKNLLTLVKGFNSFRKISKIDLKLVLAGNNNFFGNSSVKNEIRVFIKKNKICDDVLIPGYLSNSEIAFLYTNAFCYVFPSLDEGFGIPLIEAFYFNCPVVCSDADALKEIAGDAVLYFDKFKYQDLSKKLLQINDHKRRTSLIKKGKDRILLFSLENFISNYENILLKNNDK